MPFSRRTGRAVFSNARSPPQTQRPQPQRPQSRDLPQEPAFHVFGFLFPVHHVYKQQYTYTSFPVKNFFRPRHFAPSQTDDLPLPPSTESHTMRVSGAIFAPRSS